MEKRIAHSIFFDTGLSKNLTKYLWKVTKKTQKWPLIFVAFLLTYIIFMCFFERFVSGLSDKFIKK
jgi:hypothetical protein